MWRVKGLQDWVAAQFPDCKRPESRTAVWKTLPQADFSLLIARPEDLLRRFVNQACSRDSGPPLRLRPEKDWQFANSTSAQAPSSGTQSAILLTMLGLTRPIMRKDSHAKSSKRIIRQW
jgi:hypothetical protein